MRKLLSAVLLSAMATLATAQTTAPSPRPASKHTTAQSASARPTSEIIKTAGAATHDQVDGAPAPARQQAAAGGDDDHSRSGGKAMLLAALAVMAGIALRRFTRNQ